MDSERVDRSESLVVVSNRLPYDLKESSGGLGRRTIGGLVSALEPLLADRGGCWVGWDGLSLSGVPAVERALAAPVARSTPSGIELHGVPLSRLERTRYYDGFANRALWPLFHHRLDAAVFDADEFAAYLKVNRRFAETAYARVERGGRIWVHDYHLLLVPRLLRELGFAGRIDLFLHVPFPAPELFRALPWRETLLDGMLAADTIGFHVADYRDNFVTIAERLQRAESSAGAGDDVPLVHRGGRSLARVAPIGIDVDAVETLARSPAVERRRRSFMRQFGECDVIVCADRLDYTKGIRERMLVVERMLRKYPERAGRLCLYQNVVPSRDTVPAYRDLKREIDREAGRINGELGTDGWIPIHYHCRALAREDLIACYRAARVALITPLQDGMNLVAPEFVASRTDDDGVLVLSEFAGVAEQLPEAVRVNPFDLDGCANALAMALDMPADARAARMRRLRRRVRSNPVAAWGRRCLADTAPPASAADAATGRPAATLPGPVAS